MTYHFKLIDITPGGSIDIGGQSPEQVIFASPDRLKSRIRAAFALGLEVFILENVAVVEEAGK